MPAHAIFICLVSVMFHDMYESTHDKLVGQTLDHCNWWELIYADDTLLVGDRARGINILLSATKYNLKLNDEK